MLFRSSELSQGGRTSTFDLFCSFDSQKFWVKWRCVSYFQSFHGFFFFLFFFFLPFPFSFFSHLARTSATARSGRRSRPAQDCPTSSSSARRRRARRRSTRTWRCTRPSWAAARPRTRSKKCSFSAGRTTSEDSTGTWASFPTRSSTKLPRRVRVWLRSGCTCLRRARITLTGSWCRRELTLWFPRLVVDGSSVFVWNLSWSWRDSWWYTRSMDTKMKKFSCVSWE